MPRNSWLASDGSEPPIGEEVLSGSQPACCEPFVPTAVIAVSKHIIGVPRSALVTVQPLRNLFFCEKGPHWLLGATIVARSWFLALSIRSWLYGSAFASAAPGELAIVASKSGQRVGLVVDYVIGFREVHHGELLAPPPPLPDEFSDLLLGVTADSLLLVNLERIFADSALSEGNLRDSILSGTSLGARALPLR